MPRPKMPDGLYVSVSQLKTWLMCPRKYELKYIRGVDASIRSGEPGVRVGVPRGARRLLQRDQDRRASRSGGISSSTPSGPRGRRPRRGTFPSRPTMTTALTLAP